MDSHKKRGKFRGTGVAPYAPEIDVYRHSHGEAERKALEAHGDGSLYIEIAPSGGKWWRLKYRFGGKEKRLSLGVSPFVSHKGARARA